jgi:hypothetical protein
MYFSAEDRNIFQGGENVFGVYVLSPRDKRGEVYYIHSGK